ncbi:MAG: outer membrane protein assembly factor BamD [Gemmataceae bacterium]|nr:outer membrane protein assembly factor BamD [Gemmataceae bacterium]
MTKDERRTRPMPGRLLWACPWLVCLLTGCATASGWDWLPWKKKDTVADATPAATPAARRDSFVMRGLGLEREAVADGVLEQELAAAKRLLQAKDYRNAETAFHRVAAAKKAPLNLIDEALYYEAECQRLQNNYRAAEGTFRKYVKEFRVNGQYVEQANRRLFDIANYWLDNTRREMQAYEEQREGKRWFTMPSSFIHFSKDKPLFDMEGHALQLLEEVGLNDIRGSIRTVDGGPSIGEQALFYLATVKFYREDYRDADYYYSQVYENHPNSPLAPKAIKQAIICKQVMNGGAAYDTRPVEESRKLIDRYQSAYPEWTKDRDWLARQLGSIHLQQADRDYKIAEFYRRTGHPGSAYFYYELVRRRYPNTDAAKKSEERMHDLRGLAEKGQNFTAAQREPVTEQTPNAFTPPAPPQPPERPPPPLQNPRRLAPPPAPQQFNPPTELPPPTLAPAAPAPSQPTLEPPAPLPIAPSSVPPTPRLLPPSFGPGSN